MGSILARQKEPFGSGLSSSQSRREISGAALSERRKQKLRRNITIALGALSLYAIHQKSAKEIAHEIGKSVKWVRRLLRKFY